MGWWRRNRWGLIAVVPALLVLVAFSYEDLYYGVYAKQPREPIPAKLDGSYELRGTTVRLVDIGPATDLKGYDGKPFALPPNVTIWRARIEFTVPPGSGVRTEKPALDPSVIDLPEGDPDETQIGGCTITVQDAEGRIFHDDPYNLIRGAADVVAGGCFADYDAPDKSRYVNAIYFALPPDAEPVSVNIYDALSLPDYIRLTPGRTAQR